MSHLIFSWLRLYRISGRLAGRQRLALLFAEGAENTHAAKPETDDGSECGNQHDVRAEMKEVGQYRADGEYEAQYIQPQGWVNFPVEIFAQAQLQKERGQADGCNYEERKRTQECSLPGVENDESESKKKQPSGHQRPAARLSRNIWIGSGL